MSDLDALRQRVAEIPGVVDTYTTLKLEKPELLVHIDRERENLGVRRDVVGAAVVQDGRRSQRKPSPRSGDADAVGVPLAAVEVVVLVAEGEAPRAEARRDLREVAPAPGILDQEVRVNRRRASDRGAGGIDPQRAGIADIGWEQVGRGPIGRNLCRRRCDADEGHERRPRDTHGNRVMVRVPIWRWGTVLPCCGSRILRLAESRLVPPR